MIWPLDRFRSWNRSRGLQNTFQVSVRTSASPRTVCAPQIQKVLECLASIIKFMIFRNLNFWIFKKPLTVIWTLKFFESFPDWSDPKRVCLYQPWGSRNPCWKPNICLRPPLLGYALNKPSNLAQNHDFWDPKFNKFDFQLDINKQIDNYHFLINFLHAWRWWEIISWRLRSDSYGIIDFYVGVTFICHNVT